MGALGDAPAPEPPAAPADGLDTSALVAAWQQAAQAQQVFENLTADLAGLRRRAADELTAHQDKAADLAAREQRLADAETHAAAAEGRLRVLDERLQQRTGELDERDARLLAEETALAMRRQREKEELLADVRAEFATTQERLATQLRSMQEEADRLRGRAVEDLAREREAVASERAQAAEERKGLRERAVELDAREEDLVDAKALYAERERLAVAAVTEGLQRRLAELDTLYRGAREDTDRLERQLAEPRELIRVLGTDEPAEAAAELERLRGESAELRRLKLVAPDETRDRLVASEQDRQRLREERAVLLQHNEQLQLQLSGHQITAVELERLKVSKEAMAATVNAYQATVADLERKMAGLIQRRESESPFPECAKMDRDLDEARDDLDDEPPNLPDLVSRVRAIIRQQHQLYYDQADLRSLLGGLAATRLHLLQGISGTGKTQLPQRFAEAIGAQSAVVSVGADWRTPQDLMGYYNAFERRFYESEFTQAVYRAQCPASVDRPFFLVLDEMNLSHPEQYFNDVLSALERDARRMDRTDLVLMTTAVDPAPRFLRDGRKLPVPSNLWFVGTANQDETTVDFADKTYDRAHMMELPTRYQHFKAEPVDPIQPLTWLALNQAFRAARKAHRSATDHAREFVAGKLADRVLQDFDLAWGNRLNRYLGAFVPVVCAADGKLSEAVDHLVATKILRKLRGRHEIRKDRIERFRDELPDLWVSLSADGAPVKSDQVLWRELRDRGAT
jgi:AAA domain (dynein-related subfamily)